MSGQNRMRVPVIFWATLRTCSRPETGVNSASGPEPAKRPGMPRRKLIAWVRPWRSTSTSTRDDRALTTEAPTPCRPPEAV
ncbi:hypothetical protein SUDANB114_03893 [Nocardiopsis dassonvillei]